MLTAGRSEPHNKSIHLQLTLHRVVDHIQYSGSVDHQMRMAAMKLNTNFVLDTCTTDC
jgi:hypothetical protein